MIEAARARGDWAALQGEVVALLTREREPAAADALPSGLQVKAAATEFRYEHNLVSADELLEPRPTVEGTVVPEGSRSR